MKDISQMSVAEIISITGGIGSGIVLAAITGVLERIPAILILIPGFFELSGNVGGSLAARLGTALHLGMVRGKRGKKIIRNNVVSSFLIYMAASLFLGVLAFVVSSIIGINERGFDIILVSLIGGLISSAINIIFTLFTTIFLFKHNYDPDDIMGPVVTTLGDIFSTLALVIGAMVVLNV